MERKKRGEKREAEAASQKKKRIDREQACAREEAGELLASAEEEYWKWVGLVSYRDRVRR